MNLQVSGLAALVVQVGFIVVFSAPVWLAARLVGAERPTLLRAIASLFLGVMGAVVGLVVGRGLGFLVFLIIPLAFLLSFKYVLGTSFLGSILLAMIALLGYAAMMHFLGGGLNLSGSPDGTTAL